MQTNNKLREALEKIDKIVWDKIRHTKEEVEAHRIATEVLTAVDSASPEPIGDSAKMREALEKCANMGEQIDSQLGSSDATVYAFRHERSLAHNISECARAALAAPPHTGKWKNGKKYEYEYAYCSACGRMQWAGWDSHNQAEENIEAFADDYRFCPGCGAKMEGGVYVK